MNSSLFLPGISRPFHPATQQQFNQYAQHLAWVIRCQCIDSREMLACIYHYRNVYELEQALKKPGMPGPFDDAIPLEIRSTKQMRGAVAARNEHSMQIILDYISACHGNAKLRFTQQKLLALELFSSPLAHEAAFRALAGPRSTILYGHFASAR